MEALQGRGPRAAPHCKHQPREPTQLLGRTTQEPDPDKSAAESKRNRDLRDRSSSTAWLGFREWYIQEAFRSDKKNIFDVELYRKLQYCRQFLRQSEQG
ncbi:hypothetical protein SUGI_0036510 [Cryptomeria japonica]|nr:hypothetical protein SUGI_0036510 [Cryptomeria japonica]